ncbi:mechanosensitive ion channel domain-containing protein [Musa troglodytarum]|uniref:Mechanosensitive ion channel protein n=1 Tax=Musa troglodytarum TaxID=320322 RepID=A0A9E7LC65_9LILI|nr:mechanosensitive ion channel domain-containing protein [Musa troglodytarum]
MSDAPWNPFASPIPSRHSAIDGIDKLTNAHIDANGHKLWRDPSCEFLSDAVAARVPAASSRTERFGDEVDVDPKVSPVSVSASKEPHVAFEGVSATSDGGSIMSGSGDASGAEVHRWNSNASLCRTSTLLRTKTRSRLMDPAPLPRPGALAAEAGRSTTPSSPPPSAQLRSQLLGGSMTDEDDEDPFLDEDLPADDDHKRAKFRPSTALQWTSLVFIVAALSAALAVPALRRCSLWGLRLWKWVVLFLVLICGRLVSGWGIRLLVFFIERNFLLRKRVLYFVYGVRKPVRNCLWLGLVLLAWHLLFDQKIQRQTNSKAVDYVSKILICLLVATFFRLAETIVIKSLASSFHVSTYFDRIQEALFNQYVIETLSSPPWIRSQQTRDEDNHFFSEVERLQNAGAAIPADLRKLTLQKGSQNGKSARSANAMRRKEIGHKQEGITIEHLHRLSQKNVSAWIMKRMMKIVRRGTLSTLHERLVSAGMEDESSAMQIQSEREAKVAARKIFNNVAKPGENHIYLEDLMHFMREDEALKTMGLFEGAEENERVTKKSLKNWVVGVFKERRALALSLNDTKTAVNQLHQMANLVVAVIVLAIWLLILDIATMKFFLFLSSQLLLVTFVFGNTLKMIFEAIIFLFVMHPFDVGDRCEIGGVQMIVEEMNILTTIFLRYDNQKVSYPNGVLANLPIGNIYRSPDMRDAIDFSVHVSTPVEKLALMKERIMAFIERKKDHWYPGPTVVIKDVDDMNRLLVSIWLQHRMNFQEMNERWMRRELVVQEMIKVLKELEIEYRMLPLDVNLRAMPASTSTRLPSTWKACS